MSGLRTAIDVRRHMGTTSKLILKTHRAETRTDSQLRLGWSLNPVQTPVLSLNMSVFAMVFLKV